MVAPGAQGRGELPTGAPAGTMPVDLGFLHLGGRLIVVPPQRDRLDVAGRPAEGEVGDVHPVFSGPMVLAQRAEDPGTSLFVGIEHVLPDLGVVLVPLSG